MMKENILNSFSFYNVKRLLVSVTGVAITCLAVSIFYLIQLGSDPYQVLCVAIHQLLNISHGMANTLMNSAIIALMLIFKRKYIKISLFLCLIVSGPFVDLFNSLLSPVLSADTHLAIKLALIPIGCFIMGAGIFLYLAPQLGASPGDSVGIIISDMVKKPYSLVRIGIDASYTLIGFILGGPVGITTIFSVLLTGPCLGICKKLFGKTDFIQSVEPKA